MPKAKRKELRDELLYIMSQPSWAEQLFYKKNRKCLVALVLVTLIFITLMVGRTAFAAPPINSKSDYEEWQKNKGQAAAKEAEAKVQSALEAYMSEGTVPAAPGGYTSIGAYNDGYTTSHGKTKRQLIGLWSTLASAPYSLLMGTPDLATDIITLGKGNSGGSSFGGPANWGVTGDINKSLNALVDAIGDNFIPPMAAIGAAIVLLHFVIGLLGLAMSERMTIESWIKYWAKLIIALVGIVYAADLYKLFWDLGVAMTNFVNKIPLYSSSTGVGNMAYNMQIQFIRMYDMNTGGRGKGWGLVSTFGIFSISTVMCVFMILAALICMIVVSIAGLTRVLEFAVRGAFLPIGVAALADDGWHGSGGRYFKRLLALGLQGAVIILAVKIIDFLLQQTGNNIMNAALSNIGYTIAAILLLPLTMFVMFLIIMIGGIAVMFKGMQIANDMVGG